eukprot:TRINITY_DN193_c0_g3_i1.p1 TRINITY_DN193_c0_g3~~TRINITY_DN193_c0_g3_i1.p1  ORF type:complete len:1469 (+),score=409.40 TRINITY_DN193_c0_g3_i1:565-4407(+)
MQVYLRLLEQSKWKASVFTFGFTAGHNAALLRSLSDNAAGMYYYLENADKISTSFADCLGGLLSTVASQMTLTVDLPHEVSIKSLTTTFPCTRSTHKAELTLGELYAEERRNVPLTLHVSPIDHAEPRSLIATFTLSYKDTVANLQKLACCDIRIARPVLAAKLVPVAEEDSPSQESIALDEQNNRLLVASALQQAGERGSSDLDGMRRLMEQSAQTLESSKSHGTAFTQGLVRDLRQAAEFMKDRATFDTIGNKYMYSLARSHFTQRSSGISSQAAEAYLTSSKLSMLHSVTGKPLPQHLVTMTTAPAVAAPAATAAAAASSPAPDTAAKAPQSIKAKKPSNKAKAEPKPEPEPEPEPAAAAPAQLAPQVITVQTGHKSLTHRSDEMTTVAQVAWPPPVTPDRIGRAVRRLLADFKEIKQTPLRSVTAEPMEDDLFEWHCNLTVPCNFRSPYQGITFHMTLHFTPTYPFQPPRLEFCSFIKHHHVFGSWVCMDMLVEAEWANSTEESRPYTGWSSSYSVFSILLQLQSFLFEEASTAPADVTRALETARRFRCARCGHTMADPKPPFPSADAVMRAEDILQLPPPRPIELPERDLQLEPKPLPVPRQTLLKAPHPKKSAAQPVAAIARISQAPKSQKKNQETDEGWCRVTHHKKRHPVKEKQRKDQRVVQAQQRQAEAECDRLTSIDFDAFNRSAKIEPESVAAVFAAYGLSSLHGRERQQQQQQRRRPAVAAVGEPRRDELNRIGGELRQLQLQEQQLSLQLSQVAETKQRQEQQQRRQQEEEQQEEQQVLTIEEPSFGKRGRRQRDRAAQSQRESLQRRQQAQQQQQQQLEQQLEGLRLKQEQLRQRQQVLKEQTHQPLRQKTGLSGSAFAWVPDLIIRRVFAFLPGSDLNHIGEVCKDFLRLSGAKELWEGLFKQFFPQCNFDANPIQTWKRIFASETKLVRMGLACFHSKTPFTNDVLGIPITYEKNPRTGTVQYIHSTLDLLCNEAFYGDKVRRSVWKLGFTHWLPLYLNEQHGRRAWPLIQRSLSLLSQSDGLHFAPRMALDVLPKLMNTMVVSVMRGDTHASVVALEGYCAFHHMLLKCVDANPCLSRRVHQMVAEFIRNPESRVKDCCPSLGDWLPLLTVCEGITWAQARTAYLQENFDRNVLWTIKAYPHLARPDAPGTANAQRLLQTFRATAVSCRLLMFHVMFLREVARPDGVPLRQVAENLDRFYGRPSSQMKEQLLARVKQIQQASSWNDFFLSIGMQPLSPLELTEWLNQAQDNSLRHGYHRAPR